MGRDASRAAYCFRSMTQGRNLSLAVSARKCFFRGDALVWVPHWKSVSCGAAPCGRKRLVCVPHWETTTSPWKGSRGDRERSAGETRTGCMGHTQNLGQEKEGPRTSEPTFPPHSRVVKPVRQRSPRGTRHGSLVQSRDGCVFVGDGSVDRKINGWADLENGPSPHLKHQRREEGLPSSFHSEPPPLPLPLSSPLLLPHARPSPKNSRIFLPFQLILVSSSFFSFSVIFCLPFALPSRRSFLTDRKSKGKNKGRTLNSDSVSSADSQLKPLDSSALSHDGSGAVEASNGDANGVEEASITPATDGSVGDKAQKGDAPATATKQAEGDLHLYPVPVKALSGGKLELQLSPGDSVMDVRQFLLDAPETCFFTCYDLILHTKDGSIHHLEDYNEISEVADITTGGCSLEMVAGM
ncbi:hypothetical protein BHM03_00049043 [Ensete ventricosum]|nr:hypothetical protein BHM03_00049043 [Ensete ventricosum]